MSAPTLAWARQPSGAHQATEGDWTFEIAPASRKGWYLNGYAPRRTLIAAQHHGTLASAKDAVELYRARNT
jgi:hypothetical protein